MAKTKAKGKLKIISLGGVGEVGKNLTVIEYENDMIVVDCGLGFPDDDMLGVDLVIPDFTYLEKNVDRLRGVFITHGHEDHIGALPYLLRSVNVPVYATRLTIGILENKFMEHKFPTPPKLNCVNAGQTVKAGAFSVEFIHVNHSIADACAFAIRTPLGTIFHSGDFKLDITPIEGEMMDLTRIGEIGRDGVLMLLGESTNSERPGYTPSEKKVGKNLDHIFMRHPEERLVIATFSSNVHRVQQIIDKSAEYGRKVAITGRSMLNIVGAATKLGYMKVPADVLIDISDINKYPKEKLTIVTTGSQGEPMSALYRMAFGAHEKVTLGKGDMVVLSASAIPGNEKLVGKIINELLRLGANVFRDSSMEVHVSGHACQEELKLLHALLKPKFFMPIHGEYKHMVMHRDLALEMGMPEENIVLANIGQVVEVERDSIKLNGSVPAGRVLIDGYGVGDVGNIVLRDRRHLAQDGLIVVVATVDIESRTLISGPDIVSRGFVYVREAEELMEHSRAIAKNALEDCLEKNVTEWTQLKTRVKDDLSKYLYQQTKRKPMVLPVVMDI